MSAAQTRCYMTDGSSSQGGDPPLVCSRKHVLQLTDMNTCLSASIVLLGLTPVLQTLAFYFKHWEHPQTRFKSFLCFVVELTFISHQYGNA